MKLLRDRDFRALYAGQSISVVGDALFLIALPFAVLDDLGGSAGDVAAVLAAQALPFAIFVLAAGVYADRLPRTKLMAASYLVRAASQAVVAALLLSGEAELWHLVALCAVNGTADAFFMPALGGLLPSLVERGDLQRANALLAVNQRVALVAGPALAGVLIVATGPGSAIAIDAVTFLLGALLILRIAPRPGAAREDAHFWRELKEGLREVLARPWLRTFFPVFSAYHLIALPSVLALGPVLADRELEGAGSWAAITTAFGVGTVAGGLAALRLEPARPARVIALCFIVASTQSLIIAHAGSTAAIAAFQACAGVAVAYGFTLWDSAIQREIPPHAVSRVTSLDYFASVGSMPLGYAVVGPVVAVAGLHETMTAASLIVMAMCAAALVVIRRH